MMPRGKAKEDTQSVAAPDHAHAAGERQRPVEEALPDGFISVQAIREEIARLERRTATLRQLLDLARQL